MYYCKINKKSVLCIEGKDTLSFLQGLITNNIDKLNADKNIGEILCKTYVEPMLKNVKPDKK